MKLIEIKRTEKIIFVGDTHGDLEASKKVIKDYLLARRLRRPKATSSAKGRSLGEGGKPENKIVFLGDYVDRGPFSKENLEFLLEMKMKFPEQIFLLQGNHESHHILKFSPAEFWEGLSNTEYNTFSTAVEKFLLAVVTNDIIALHGALPDLKNLEEINKINLGDENWFRICWGDFVEENGEYLDTDFLTGRPRFSRDYFFKIMERFGKRVLIRSHQPGCPQFMFDDRCLTIFTSSAYTRERTIAIYDFEKSIKTAKDLEIVKI
jgi:predicted phosphodiesterase